MTKLRIKRITHTAILPAYQSAGAAGLDLHADLPNGDLQLLPGEWTSIGTGIAVAIPPGYEGQVRGRSGLAFKRGVQYFVGTIDSDYRGEIHVQLRHETHELDWLVIKPGDRIAQLVIAPVALCTVVPCDELDETERGANGFGSTGMTDPARIRDGLLLYVDPSGYAEGETPPNILLGSD